ncbi:hypothetical protein V5O48_010343 [Marasmius crinis-equi]|uniref:Uncharacterized protein n=1 Tax=Marasmius crinis-equi TaxID=585013 RepID=A0ABR3F922_9AGAR
MMQLQDSGTAVEHDSFRDFESMSTFFNPEASISAMLEPVIDVGVDLRDFFWTCIQQEVRLYDVSTANQCVTFWRQIVRTHSESNLSIDTSPFLCLPHTLVVDVQSDNRWSIFAVTALLDSLTLLPKLSNLVFSNLDVPFSKFFEILPSLSNLEYLQLTDVKVSFAVGDFIPSST